MNNNHELTDLEQQKEFPLSKEEYDQWQTWVPEGLRITNMQIYEAKSRGIPIPNGDPVHDTEYRQFLDEHALEFKKKPNDLGSDGLGGDELGDEPSRGGPSGGSG